MKAKRPLSFIFLTFFATDRRNSVAAVPAPQIFAPFTASWATATPAPPGFANPIAPGRPAPMVIYSLPPASEVFYAMTRGEDDPPAPFETATRADIDTNQFAPAVVQGPPDDAEIPVPQPDDADPLPDSIPLILIPTFTPTSTLTSAQPASSRLVPSTTQQPSRTTSSPPPESTIIAPPLPVSKDGGRSSGLRLSIFKVTGIVVGSLAAVSLCAFLLLNPRVSRGCRNQRVRSKGLGKRPISSWFPFPSSSPPSTPIQRKAVRPNTQRGLELEVSEHGMGGLSPYPRSKFSVSSSDYSQMSRTSSSTTDTVLVENTRLNGSIPPPTRPPRPPTADGPFTISDSVYFAPENQVYMESALGNSDDEGQAVEVRRSETDSPLLPPSTFFTMPSFESTIQETFKTRDPFWSVDDERLTPREESRHSRTHSAPIFVGNPIDASYQPAYIDPVARRVMQHRRSRSNSGWAYPKRDMSIGEEDSYHGVFGRAL